MNRILSTRRHICIAACLIGFVTNGAYAIGYNWGDFYVGDLTAAPYRWGPVNAAPVWGATLGPNTLDACIDLQWTLGGVPLVRARTPGVGWKVTDFIYWQEDNTLAGGGDSTVWNAGYTLTLNAPPGAVAPWTSPWHTLRPSTGPTALAGWSTTVDTWNTLLDDPDFVIEVNVPGWRNNQETPKIELDTNPTAGGAALAIPAGTPGIAYFNPEPIALPLSFGQEGTARVYVYDDQYIYGYNPTAHTFRLMEGDQLEHFEEEVSEGPSGGTVFAENVDSAIILDAYAAEAGVFEAGLDLIFGLDIFDEVYGEKWTWPVCGHAITSISGLDLPANGEQVLLSSDVGPGNEALWLSLGDETQFGLLVVIPEPSSLSLLAVGAVGALRKRIVR